MTLNTDRLIRISKATASSIGAWKEGVSIERDAGVAIETICLRVAAGRWKLATHMRAQGDIALASSHALYRAAISRYYYAMYHAVRAASFLFHGGDDHEKHSVLPGKVPGDFPNSAHWSNQLKSAREHRNNADYDPYPWGTLHWKRIAFALQSDAAALVTIARQYLRGKGCAV